MVQLKDEICSLFERVLEYKNLRGKNETSLIQQIVLSNGCFKFMYGGYRKNLAPLIFRHPFPELE